MSRPTWDETGMEMARVAARRATCIRKNVGCVLFDKDGRQVGGGYNGPASGERHCIDFPCEGAQFDNGEGLDICEAIHAEQNALIFCSDVRLIHTCYVTASPCLPCTKLLLNTSCRRIVFDKKYISCHDAARALWLRQTIVQQLVPRHVLHREWIHHGH